jgi:hypothetical protein
MIEFTDAFRGTPETITFTFAKDWTSCVNGFWR